jgi:hypothetical protein
MVTQFSLPCWSLSVPFWCYLLQCLIATILLRVIFFAFRAAAVIRGDFPGSDPEPDKPNEPGKGWTFRHAFWECFIGFSQSKAHADLGLNAIIGFFELAAYPILFGTGYIAVVGGWLVLKTAGNWGGWTVSRTSFNRFLLNNILELAISYFWLMRYIHGCGGKDLLLVTDTWPVSTSVELQGAPLLHYLIANLPNWIQALAAVGLVILTLLTLRVLRGYAEDTAKIASTGIAQIEKMDMPFVALLQKPAEQRHQGGWAIENRGSGTAINIRHSEPHGNDGWVQSFNRPLSVGDFSFLAINIDVMRNRVFVIEYESLSGKKYRTTVDWPEGAMRTRFAAVEA